MHLAFPAEIGVPVLYLQHIVSIYIPTFGVALGTRNARLPPPPPQWCSRPPQCFYLQLALQCIHRGSGAHKHGWRMFKKKLPRRAAAASAQYLYGTYIQLVYHVGTVVYVVPHHGNDDDDVIRAAPGISSCRDGCMCCRPTPSPSMTARM